MNEPTPPVFDPDSLLEPIPGDNPSGESLAYEPEYDQIREARRSDDDSLDQGEWKPKERAKAADWDRVAALGIACLRDRTKDLQIAGWVAEAWAHLHGFAGLRDGLRLLHGLQSKFWGTYHPEIDDGDLESRHGPFKFLNDPAKGLPLLIRSIPLTGGPSGERFAYSHYQESRETDNAIKKNPENEKAILAEGKLTSKRFDDAVAETPKAFYARLVADLHGGIEAFQAFERDTDERFGRDAPSLLNVGKALEECARLLDATLAAKREIEPDPLPEAEAEAETPEARAAADGEADGPPPGVDGEPAVPRRRVRVGTALEQEALDYGRVLIDFRERAVALAEAGARLAENRGKYAELLAELRRLDDEYEELSRVVSRDRECYQLLSRLLRVRGGPP